MPNAFDDYGSGASYHTADASLWFVHAVHAYGRRNPGAVIGSLVAACRDVVAAYRDGTDFGIGLDPADGLMRIGDGVQCLTWMDAKRGGCRFTPRDGKPVEINALWLNALYGLAELTDDPGEAARLRAMAEQTGSSMRERFWWPERSCLYDVVDAPDARAVAELRPNQIFAVSLPCSPLTPEQRAGVVRAVGENLLTPYGLRTLAPDDPAYCGRYEGDLMQRDAAYHNGTVWPWLIGPYATAVLRVGGFEARSRSEARSVIAPLLDSLDSGCLHQVAEVYDGDPPHRPSGCPAQAWSVAELQRVLGILDHPAES
jgi:4-alpha-glucanotransferase